MVGDTAITGGPIELREREYAKKVFRGPSSSLIAFSGDLELGRRIARMFCAFDEFDSARSFLIEESGQVPSVDFLVAHVGDDTGPTLERISQRQCASSTTFYIGSSEAFNEYQHIRHNIEISHAPDSVHSLMVGHTGKDHDVPDEIPKNIRCFFELFASRQYHDVGGWATPYYLTKENTCRITYAFGVTDPVVNTLSTGDPVGLGTAENGGFSLSYYDLVESDGSVVYYLQIQKGYVYKSEFDSVVLVQGNPDDFEVKASDLAGEPARTWFSSTSEDKSTEAETMEVRILSDATGNQRIAVARKGRSISFSWIQGPSEPFSVKTTDISMSAEDDVVTPFEISTDPNGSSLNLKIREGFDPKHLQLSTNQLDELIFVLAQSRAKMEPAFPDQPSKTMGVFNPVWRTEPQPHPMVPGSLLHLKHPSFGWLTYILPANEEVALGSWLVHDGKRKIPPEENEAD